MTDNELKKWNKEAEDRIIKALECCSRATNTYDLSVCEQCPYDGECNTKDKNFMQDALDLINRQKAEIERLCMEIDELIIAKDLLFDEAEALIKKAKVEAVKEFAERLKAKSNKTELVCSGTLVRTEYTITKETLDNLVKEMVGDGNG